MQDENTDNCHFLMWEGGKMRSCRSKGKDKDGLTVVPLTGNRIQTRKSRLEHINQEKEKEIPNRRKRTRR